MNWRSILTFVVVVILIYVLYMYFFGGWGSRQYLDGLHQAQKEKTINAHQIPDGRTSDYTFSIWVYVDNWNYRIGEKKIIFGRLTSGANPYAPEVAFDPTLNNVVVSLATYTPTPSGGGTTGPSTPVMGGAGSTLQPTTGHTCTLDNVPLQTWANIIMTVNSRTLDLYLDGKLVRTCVLPGVPKTSSGADVFLTPDGGFYGYTSNFQYLPQSINPREAYAIYKEGPGAGSYFSNLLNKYRIKVEFLDENKVINSFEI